MDFHQQIVVNILQTLTIDNLKNESKLYQVLHLLVEYL
jgi:hypothetical protein